MLITNSLQWIKYDVPRIMRVFFHGFAKQIMSVGFFCKCHWNCTNFFFYTQPHLIFFCLKQMLFFSCCRWFWIYYGSLCKNPMNGKAKIPEKRTNRPNKLIRTKQNMKCKIHMQKPSRKWTHERLNQSGIKEMRRNWERQLKRGQQINEWNRMVW